MVIVVNFPTQASKINNLNTNYGRVCKLIMEHSKKTRKTQV